MNKAKIICYAFLCSLLISLWISCKENNSTSINFKKFPKTIELKGRSILSKDSVNIKVDDAYFLDSLIIIIPKSNNKHLVYLYNKNNFNFIKSSVNKGKGPYEINTLGRSCINKKEKTLYLHDWAKAKIFIYPLDSLINKTEYYSKNFFKYPREIDFLTGGINSINDSSFLLGGEYKDDILFVMQNEKILDTIGKLPNKTKNYAKESYYHYQYNHKTDYNSSKNTGIVAYEYYDIIEIFDLETGNKIKKIVGPDKIKPALLPNGLVITNKSHGAYKEIKSDNNYLYLSYVGDYLITRAKSDYKITVTRPSEIHIHNLEGKPLINLKLDRQFITFLIDKEKNQIITLGSTRKSNEGLFRIYKYPLKNLY